MPDLNHPYGLIPWKIAGLKITIGTGSSDGQVVTTTVVKIPMAGLPKQLQFRGKVGGRFRINVLRYLWNATSSGHRRLAQYNLFPVPLESQAFAPYLMGRLALISSNDVGIALRH